MIQLSMRLFVRLAIVLGTLLPGFSAHQPVNAAVIEDQSNQQYAPLPFAITSFGAARIGDSIYVYGGHTGQSHSYSTEEQSNELLKLDLSRQAATWEKIAEGPRLQGLAMVAHGDKLILVGGFTALNKAGEDQNLQSQTDVRVYNTVTGEWSMLPPLPSGRSSHDAAVIGDTLYVLGGWTMAGEKETEWQTAAISLDLSAVGSSVDQAVWKTLPDPEFRRRALAVAPFDEKLYVIGGMNQQGGPTRDVAIYDPQTDQWTKGPALEGDQGMVGFGAAAWSVGDSLVATTYTGEIQVLSKDGSQWRTVGNTKDARFFHRLLPLTDHSLLSVGGANMEEGKYLDPEVVSIND